MRFYEIASIERISKLPPKIIQHWLENRRSFNLPGASNRQFRHHEFVSTGRPSEHATRNEWRQFHSSRHRRVPGGRIELPTKGL